MADAIKCPPLTRSSVIVAHTLIKPYIHLTPILTSTTLSDLASTPQSPSALKNTEWKGEGPARPKMRFFFKCENFQRIGAFKCRGAFHALARLTDEELAKGVVTHSSGNHAQALALAARTRGIPAYIVMPTISTPSKIAATKGYGAEVIFSGSTSEEREVVVEDVIKRTGAVLVPPYDHPDIILGQGTMGLEMEEQVGEMLDAEAKPSSDEQGERQTAKRTNGENGTHGKTRTGRRKRHLDAVIAPIGGGGMLAGIATYFSSSSSPSSSPFSTPDHKTHVFGAEPSFEGADDARRGLAADRRIESVRTLTIADGLRTPVGEINWTVVSDGRKVRGIYSVSEEQIKRAMRLVVERMKVLVEPSAVVGLAVCLFDEGFRRLVEREAGDEGWNVGVVLSGGNTTLEAVSDLFAAPSTEEAEREEGVLSREGDRVAENVAG
ncbi:MAG: hypothetical protein M1827_004237 [Pycnora praestabilis]|nr:MAG: hypothetical protein M1827_004237 [Pycnora praestabilis]